MNEAQTEELNMKTIDKVLKIASDLTNMKVTASKANMELRELQNQEHLTLDARGFLALIRGHLTNVESKLMVSASKLENDVNKPNSLLLTPLLGAEEGSDDAEQSEDQDQEE